MSVWYILDGFWIWKRKAGKLILRLISFKTKFFKVLFECKQKLKANTISLWTYINASQDEYLNKEYIEYDKSLKFSTNYLKLWTSFYFQFKEPTNDLNTNDANSQLQKGAINSVGNLLENIAPNGLNFLSNGFKLFNHIKSNLRN